MHIYKFDKILLSAIANSKVAIVIIGSLLFIGCEKSDKIIDEAPQPAIPSLTTSKTDKLKQLATELLSLGQNRNFKAFVYDECKKQKFGDYYVRITDLMKDLNRADFFPAESRNTISALVNNLKKVGGKSPILFYPSVETKESQKNKRTLRTNTEDEEIIGVMNDGSIREGNLHDE